jgi:hypothetical protein
LKDKAMHKARGTSLVCLFLQIFFQLTVFAERGIFACEFVAHPTFQPFASNHRLVKDGIILIKFTYILQNKGLCLLRESPILFAPPSADAH